MSAQAETIPNIPTSFHRAEQDLPFVPYQDGSAVVWLNYSNARARARLKLGEEWNVKACEELVAALGELEMVSDARLVY